MGDTRENGERPFFLRVSKEISLDLSFKELVVLPFVSDNGVGHDDVYVKGEKEREPRTL